MSRQGPRRPVPREIQALRRRVNRWRKTRTKRSPMPEALWQEATRLAGIHGVSAVSRHASVGYASLQKRAEAAFQERVYVGYSMDEDHSLLHRFDIDPTNGYQRRRTRFVPIDSGGGGTNDLEMFQRDDWLFIIEGRTLHGVHLVWP